MKERLVLGVEADRLRSRPYGLSNLARASTRNGRIDSLSPVKDLKNGIKAIVIGSTSPLGSVGWKAKSV